MASARFVSIGRCAADRAPAPLRTLRTRWEVIRCALMSLKRCARSSGPHVQRSTMVSAASAAQRSRCCNRHELLNSLACHSLIECGDFILIEIVELLFGCFELAVKQVEDLDL